MPAKVVVPTAVEAEIAAIGDYVAEDNTGAAVALMERLRDRCFSLETFPNRGAPYGEHHRMLVEGEYLIFYRVSEAEDAVTVIIVAIVHGARDVPSLLPWEEREGG